MKKMSNTLDTVHIFWHNLKYVNTSNTSNTSNTFWAVLSYSVPLVSPRTSWWIWNNKSESAKSMERGETLFMMSPCSRRLPFSLSLKVEFPFFYCFHLLGLLPLQSFESTWQRAYHVCLHLDMKICIVITMQNDYITMIKTSSSSWYVR